MKHAIVGLGAAGAANLSKLYAGLFNSAIPQHKREIIELFYVYPFMDESISSQMGFVPEQNCYAFSPAALEGAEPALMKDMRNALKRYPVSVQAVDSVSRDLNPALNRRMYAVMFHSDAKAFLKRLLEFLSDSLIPKDVTFVVDSSDAPNGAIMMRMVMLIRKAFGQSVPVYAQVFHDASTDAPDERLASRFAFLSELSYGRQNGLHAAVSEYADAEDYKRKLEWVTSQMLDALLGLPLMSFADEQAIYGDDKTFVGVKDLTVTMDRASMLQAMAKQVAVNSFRSFFYADFDPNFTRPDWIDRLFSDRQWLLHDDFLNMSIPIGPNAARQTSQWSSVEKEWDSRSEFFLGKLNEEDSWDVQYQDFERNMQGAYSRMFRGHGVDLFYAVNETGIKASADLIKGQIESQLVGHYCAREHTLSEIYVIIEEIVERLAQRRQTANTLYEHQKRESSENIDRFRKVYDDYDAGTKSDKRNIARSAPVSEVARYLRDHYVAECHIKSLNFCRRLLTSAMEGLEAVKNQIADAIAQADKVIEERMAGMQGLTVKFLVDSPLHKHFEVASLGAAGEVLTGKFAQESREVAERSAQAFFSREDHAETFAQIFRSIMSRRSFDVLASEAASNFSYASGMYYDIPLEASLFKQSMIEFSNSGNEALAQSVEALCGTENTLADKEAPRQRFWLFPPGVFSDDELKTVAAGFLKLESDAQPVKNADMVIDSVLLRSMAAYPLSALPGFERMREAYVKQVLSDRAFANLLAMHPDSRDLFPPYEGAYVEKGKPDAIRKDLMLGELIGVVFSNSEGVYLGYDIGEEGVMFLMGKSFPDVLANASPVALRQLHYLVEAKGAPKYFPAMIDALSARLAEIRGECLHGKTDVRKATWQEAGAFMPWTRMYDKLVALIKRETGIAEREKAEKARLAKEAQEKERESEKALVEEAAELAEKAAKDAEEKSRLEAEALAEEEKRKAEELKAKEEAKAQGKVVWKEGGSVKGAGAPEQGRTPDLDRAGLGAQPGSGAKKRLPPGALSPSAAPKKGPLGRTPPGAASQTVTLASAVTGAPVPAVKPPVASMGAPVAAPAPGLARSPAAPGAAPAPSAPPAPADRTPPSPPPGA